MIARIHYKNRYHSIDLEKPLDISIPVKTPPSVTAWELSPPTIAPHTAGTYTGSVRDGGSVNFNDIAFNPHAHGTHTECAGHITPTVHSVNQSLARYFFFAELITLGPERIGNDLAISKKQVQYALGKKKREAVVIRTLPNLPEKREFQYSDSNPPYLTEAAAQWLCEIGVAHLLIDLPSVDKEHDNGALLAHRAFWDLEGTPRLTATITELIYVANAIADGTYFLDLQLAPFENDAAPSRPLLYALMD